MGPPRGLRLGRRAPRVCQLSARGRHRGQQPKATEKGPWGWAGLVS